MLKELTVRDLDGGLNLVDIGCSGDLDAKWDPVLHLINYVGFDPNKEECERLNAEPSTFHSKQYLPFAVYDGKDHTLYKTASIYCYSLRPPNRPWLDRFAYRDLFEVVGTETVSTRRLDSIKELAGMDVDAIKVDSQGLDRSILESGEDLLKAAMYVEAEPGFLENYSGEETFSEVDIYLREKGFLLFDLELFRQPRTGELGKASPVQQLLWCQGLWLHDFIAHPPAERLTRGKALKTLLLCAVTSCWDFGLELAEGYRRADLITDDELKKLTKNSAWDLL
ncbi:MAG: FkbM family methyltransferase [Desulfovibrionaceae bacterium]|nr:FkbM family methyltransferase [Desulfovibrionaceae bacterium]